MMGLQPTVALAICFLTTYIIKYSYGRTPPDENPVAPIGEKEGVRPRLVHAMLVYVPAVRVY